MLEDMNITNFALIDKLNLDFTAGLNILSGETGAGKSILIGAITFLLGGKGGVELIRSGSTEARVSGTMVLHDEQKEAAFWLSEHAIDLENNRILLRRTIRDNGKSSAWIGEVAVTRNELSEFTSFLVDIHGQHEHQSLLKPSEHRKYLDSYAGITLEVSDFSQMYTALIEKRKVLDEMNTSDSQRMQKIDFLSFAIDEISTANLKSSEEDDLNAEELRLSQYEKLYAALESITEILQGDENNLVVVLKKLRSMLEHAGSLDSALKTYADRFDSFFYEFSDVTDEIRSYKQSLVFDPNRLEAIQERLALIFKLKKKYAPNPQATLSDVLQYAEDAQNQLEQLKQWEGNKTALRDEVTQLEKQVYSSAKKLSEKRKTASEKMASQIERVLADLGMKGTQFAVSLTLKDGDATVQKCGPYGLDNIEFLISPNPGSALRSLSKIASGGELSRVMLAIKTILADTDTAGTLIFDEIDTGIGGEVAISVGKHLKSLSKHRQVLCITHLASIAACANTHIKIEKSISDAHTTTNVYTITGTERVNEIARMLSGDADNETSREHARLLVQKFGE